MLSQHILDDFNREIVNIVVDTSIISERVSRELTQVFEWCGKPETIRVDNGPEFLALTPWCDSNGIELKFIQPGKPNQNAYLERSIAMKSLVAICLKNLHQARYETEKFIWKYNNICPHDRVMKSFLEEAFSKIFQPKGLCQLG